MFEHLILSYFIDICAIISKTIKKYFNMLNLEYWCVRVSYSDTQVPIRDSLGQQQYLVTFRL